MKIKPGSYFDVFLITVMLLVIGVAWRWSSLEAKLLPSLFAGIVLALLAFQLVRDVKAKGKAEVKEKKVIDGGRVSRFGLAAVSLIGFTLGIYLIGFVIAVPLFVLSYLKSRGRSWRLSIVFAVSMGIFIFGVFELGLQAHLYEGLVFELLDIRLGG